MYLDILVLIIFQSKNNISATMDATMKRSMAMQESSVFNGEDKLDKFDGSNYLRWQDRMKWLLTFLNVFYILSEDLAPLPTLDGHASEKKKEEWRQAKEKREAGETLCRGYILNTLSQKLYDIYSLLPTAKEVWISLNEKYKHVKQGTDRFLAMKIFEYKFDEKLNILDQVRDHEIFSSSLRAI